MYREILNPPHRHGPPVDIWGIGVLATQLLAGISKMDTMDLLHAFARSPGDMQEPTDELDRIFDELEQIRSECIQPDAIDFIRRCFQVNPKNRMTAAEAMEHRWLCTPDDDRKLFMRREEETTAGWRRRGVLGDVVKDIPDLRRRMADGSPLFVPKERRPGLHATRRTAESKEETDEKTESKKRSRIQDISMLPQCQGLERRLRLMSTVPSREAQEQLLKTLTESGRLLVPRHAKDQGVDRAEEGDGDEDEDGDDRPSKRLKV